MTSPTKSGFVLAIEREIVQRHAWAKDAAKLATFMDAVRNTITTTASGHIWHHQGPASDAAWREIGGKGKPSLKALRALPD